MGPGSMRPDMVTTLAWESEAEMWAEADSVEVTVPASYARPSHTVMVTALVATPDGPPPSEVWMVGWMLGEDIARYPLRDGEHVVPVSDLHPPLTHPRKTSLN